MVTKRTTPLFVVTAWAGKGCLYMTRPVTKTHAGDLARKTISEDDRCTSVVIRGEVEISVMKMRRAVRSPDGAVHTWQVMGPGRLAGFPHYKDIYGERGGFNEGWVDADPAYAAAQQAEKDAHRLEVRHDGLGNKYLALSTTTDDAEFATQLAGFLTKSGCTGVEIIDRVLGLA